MPKIIEVPGMGQVPFPDGMTDADISQAIQRNLRTVQSAPAPTAEADYAARKWAAVLDGTSQRASVAEQAAADKAAADHQQVETAYGIAGLLVFLVVVVVLLRKCFKSRPWRLIPQAVRSAAIMKDKMLFDLSDQDAEWFAGAEEELVSGNIDKATWARALVKAGGNEEKRRGDYILLRVKKLRLGAGAPAIATSQAVDVTGQSVG